MGKPTKDDEVGAMLEMARGYFDRLVSEWAEAPNHGAGLSRVKMLFRNGHDCLKIAMERAKELAAKEDPDA